MENGKSKKEYKTIGGILLAFTILMPLIQAALIAFYRVVFAHSDPFPGIVWNDEAVYLKLIENYAKYINPLGYWGFDANHAILGNGPAWSPAIILPYALIAAVIPAGAHFVFFCNLFFMVLANGVFCLFVKPKKYECINLICFQIVSVPVLLYLCTNMSELYRYAIAIVLAGMLWYMYTGGSPEENGKKTILKNIVRYAVIPLIILYAVQVYTFFAFALPLYVCSLLKDKKWYVRFGISLPVTGIVTFASYYFLHLISSNYNIGKSESLFNALSNRDIPGAVKSFFFMMKEGASGIWYLKNYIKVMPLYPYSVVLALILAGIGIFLSVWGKNIPEKKNDVYVGRMIAHSVPLFYLMYMTLYTIVPDTFYRGTQIVIVFSLYLIATSKREYLVRFLLLFSLLGMFLARPQLSLFTEHHYETSQNKEEWKELRADLSKVMDAKKGAPLWDNTVLMYTMEPKAIMAIPVGFAENFVLTEGTFSSEPGYLFFSKANPIDSDPGWVVQSHDTIFADNRAEFEENYIVIYETKDYILYQKGQK
ncbi:MAG: hypothetical protein IKO32_04165 [Lachnospiraceae bacterium]|nr:hypothetical protein [Lachnospiraceae bacterium]